MLTYDDFCKSCKFKNHANNTDAEAVFNLLCKPENVNNMIVCTELKLPAISGIVKDLEENFASAPLFPLKDYQNRQIVGRMVKFIMAYFGYYPIIGNLDERAKLRNFSEAKLFKTSSVYFFNCNKSPIYTTKVQIVENITL